jgi:hypothetical protein
MDGGPESVDDSLRDALQEQARSITRRSLVTAVVVTLLALAIP